MAACFEKLGNYEEMSEAARGCIKADRSFVKGYFRLASAYKCLNQLTDCIKALESGLAVDATNKDLKQMKKDVLELQRAETVATYCTTAEQQIRENDVYAAYKTLEAAKRLDGGSPDVQRLAKKIVPLYEKAEQKRKAGMSGASLFKEKGDDLYKAANFEGAIEQYSKCIDQLKKDNKADSELALKAYSNRAACFKQISNFDGVISDCTSVLEVEPDNVKALIRRAQAFEGVERYRFALQDCKTVLTLGGPDKIGKANYDLCNGLQHRLQRTVDQLKKMG